MILEATNFSSIERFIKEHPREADALAFKWREFVKTHPETISFETAGEFYTWMKEHPETDRDVWLGKEIQDVYFYLRETYEDRQMQTEGSVNPSVIPADLPYLPLLAIVFLKERPRIMEDDKDYQKITGQLKKLWFEENPGKDFKSREGLDYLYGSLEDDNAATLKKDAEKAFRNNPKYLKRVERYDKEKNKIYKNPNNDPIVANLKKTVAEHTRARQQLPGTPTDIDQVIQKKSLEMLPPEKAVVYTKKGGGLIKTEQEEEEERKKGEEAFKKELERQAREYIQRKATDYAKRGIRRVGKLSGQEGGRLFRNTARGGGRLAIQGSRAAATGIRTAIQGAMLAGRGGALLVSNPIGWIVIAIIVAIFLIVFLIIFFFGLAGGGATTGRIYECSYRQFAVPNTYCSDGFQQVECIDPATEKSIAVPDGNTCATNLATYYSQIEGVPITARCIDKCTNFYTGPTYVCAPDEFNGCPESNLTCEGFEGTPISTALDKTFCIEYTITQN